MTLNEDSMCARRFAPIAPVRAAKSPGERPLAMQRRDIGVDAGQRKRAGSPIESIKPHRAKILRR
jgi:hypothetical protein